MIFFLTRQRLYIKKGFIRLERLRGVSQVYCQAWVEGDDDAGFKEAPKKN